MRVLVFRQPEQGEETAARLASRGHDAILAPVLSIAPTGTAPPPGPFDALLVTSRNAITALAAYRDVMAGLRVFAVGPRTGAALAAAGFRDVEVADGDAASLAALAAERLPPGGALLHAAGRDRRAEPRSTLDATGFRVTTWEIYAAEPTTRLPEVAKLALAGGTVDAALHYSPRSAATAERLAREAGLGAAFADMLHVCLSTNVAGAFTERPPRLAVADEPSEESLLNLLAQSPREAD